MQDLRIEGQLQDTSKNLQDDLKSYTGIRSKNMIFQFLKRKNKRQNARLSPILQVFTRILQQSQIGAGMDISACIGLVIQPQIKTILRSTTLVAILIIVRSPIKYDNDSGNLGSRKLFLQLQCGSKPRSYVLRLSIRSCREIGGRRKKKTTQKVKINPTQIV